jgi:hypothetical protein
MVPVGYRTGAFPMIGNQAKPGGARVKLYSSLSDKKPAGQVLPAFARKDQNGFLTEWVFHLGAYFVGRARSSERWHGDSSCGTSQPKPVLLGEQQRANRSRAT